MKITVLQHTPNGGLGMIRDYAHLHKHELYVYHPYQFGILPQANEIDFLIILGGPMSPNDDLDWIVQERKIITELLARKKPIIGFCYGAQQIAKTLGYKVTKSPYKEVGWAKVYRQCDINLELPDSFTAFHWHEEMFEVPQEAKLLFSSDLVKNQGFILGDNVVGLQFHFEQDEDSVREVALNDGNYALQNNALHQTPEDIIKHGVPKENKEILFKLLDYLLV